MGVIDLNGKTTSHMLPLGVTEGEGHVYQGNRVNIVIL